MKTLYLIANSHIDPIWQWDWQEGAAATLSTFKSAADLLEEYDYKEFSLRMGYLQAQNDSAGMYKYKKAIAEGKSKEEAAKLSRIKGKKK